MSNKSNTTVFSIILYNNRKNSCITLDGSKRCTNRYKKIKNNRYTNLDDGNNFNNEYKMKEKPDIEILMAAKCLLINIKW